MSNQIPQILTNDQTPQQFTWNSITWLEDNFFINNGLPHFFIEGKYSYLNKEVAVTEYKNAVFASSISSNESLSKWSKSIISAGFSVLNNRDILSFWDGMLDSERRDQENRSYNELIFYNNSPEVFSTSTKRNHNTRSTTTSPESSPSLGSPSTFNENDNVFIGGSQISLGTQVGRLSRSMTITDRKTRYFLTLGNNGILDISDTSIGSQMSTFTQTVQDLIKQRFPKLTFASNNSITSQIESQKSRITEMNDRSYLKKFLKLINEMPKLEKYDSTKRVYILVIELLLHDAYIFDKEESEELSEADILIKVWGQLLEMVFRGSGVILHWGDTVANNCKQEGKRIKLDLRIIAGSLTNQSLLPDTSVGELAPRVLRNKHYKDKLKTVLSCKMNLNDRITDSANLNINHGSFKLPHIIVMGMEAVVYTMEIEASGLYLINEVQNLNFPMSVTEVKNGAIETLMNGLSNFKKMATNLKKDDNEILEAKKSKKRKTMKKFTSSNQNVSTSDASEIDWLRPIWFPPTYNLSDSEFEND